MTIKNIIFDIGNVMVRWDPLSITTELFPEHPNIAQLNQQLFKSATWFDLNLGKITDQQALQQYQQNLGIDPKQLEQLMPAVKRSLTPITGSAELVAQLYQAQYPLYALTDNTKEIMAFLKAEYDFWRMFRGVVVSAEIGVLKPNPAIYEYLLNTYQLTAQETLFIDDHQPNIDGAQAVGIQALRFETVKKCIEDLKKIYQLEIR